MKTKKKIVLALLTLSCLAAGAVGLTACGGGEHAHTYSNIWTAGETQHWYAANCGHTGEKLAVGDHVWGAPALTTPATETTLGVQTLECVVCHKTKTESIDMAGHTYSANWTADANNHWHAATCSHTEEKNGETAHTWGEWQTVVASTHTTQGVRLRACTVCNYAETDQTATTGEHTYNTAVWAYDNGGHYFAANCGHDEQQGYEPHSWVYVAADNSKTVAEGKNDFYGYHQKKCAKQGANQCNLIVWEAHNFKWTVITAATCTTDGLRNGVCECGMEKNNDVIPATGHSVYENLPLGKDETGHWKQVACEHGDAAKNVKAHDWNAGVIGKNEAGKTVITKTCQTCGYISETEVDGVTSFDLVAKLVKNGNPTGNAVSIVNDEIHVRANTETNFDFINLMTDGSSASNDAIASFKSYYKKISVYDVASDGTKTPLTSVTEGDWGPVLSVTAPLTSIDWRTASPNDVVYFRLNVTDGQTHKFLVETEFASKEFTVIPDLPSAIEVKCSTDGGATWTVYDSSNKPTVAVGEEVWFTANIAGCTCTSTTTGVTITEHANIEGLNEVYVFTKDSAGSSVKVTFTYTEGVYGGDITSTARVTVTAAE